MFCRNCGRSLPENAAFCPNCGTALLVPKPPVEDVKETVVEEAAPAVEEVAPVVEEVAPVVEEVAPAVEEAAPVVEEAAPVVEEAAHVAAQPVNAQEPAAEPAAEPEQKPELTPEEKKSKTVMLLGVVSAIGCVLYLGGLLFNWLFGLILQALNVWQLRVVSSALFAVGNSFLCTATLVIASFTLGKALEIKGVNGSLEKNAKLGYTLALIALIVVIALVLLSAAVVFFKTVGTLF